MCDFVKAVDVDSPSSGELQIIEESEIEDAAEEAKVSHSQVKLTQARNSIESTDSDVSLNYDSTSNERDVEQHERGDRVNTESSDSGTDDNRVSGKDSGCEVSGITEPMREKENEKSEEDESPFEPPDDELAKRIVDQVEFYFSDDNITKDAFLLKHVKRNKEGYVSLKLISSFKRIKHLAKDWRVVAYALKRSTKLEVNEAKTKLRRVDPLPLYDQTTPSRTVVAINLPMEKPTIENVAEIFREYGEIVLIRILRPGNPVPADVRSFANKHPEMSGTMSALIEFERTESAKLAISNLDTDWRSGVQGMKVIELNAPLGDKKKKIQTKKTSINKLLEGELSSSCQSSSEAEMDAKFLRRRSSSPHPTRGADIPRLQRRFSANRDLGANFLCHDSYKERPYPCCNHCDRRYSSSGSGYDSPAPSNYRRYSINKDAQDTGYQIPAMRRSSGVDSSCCFLRRCSRDSGSESSGSYTRSHDFGRRYSRDSVSSNESAFQRRFSRDSVSSESIGNYRRLSRDSVNSDVFAPPFLSRSNSRDLMELPRRASFGSTTGCAHHPLIHAGSRSSFTVPPNYSSTYSPHTPENVVRMPKGPDGSKGFIAS